MNTHPTPIRTANTMEHKMRRVTPDTVSDILNAHGKTVLLFGAPVGEPTASQAHAFAEAWIDHRKEAAFGYVDAFEHVALARMFKVRVLPTVLVMNGRNVEARLEGVCPAARIGEALTMPSEARAA